MKKIVAVLAFVLAVLSISAQNKLLYYSNGNVIYTKTIENVDSVSFLPTGTSSAYTNISDETPFTFPVMGIDSIVLYMPSLDGDEDPQQQDEGDWIYITYTNGGAVGVVNPWANRYITVTCNGEHVSVSAASGTEDRTIVVAGTTTNGSLTINTDNKFDLRLNGADITNPSGPAINVPSDKRVKLILEDGTTNSLTDGSVSTEKAALLCEGSIEVYGNGTLNVAGNRQHGINSDAHINIYTGTINVTSAVKDGIHANNFRLYGGNVTVSGFGSDGIEAEYSSVEHADQGTIKLMGGSLNMTVANADGKGLKCDTLTIQGGTHNFTASGAQTKAIKSTIVYIAGGNTTITASGAAVVTDSVSYCTGIKATNMYVTDGQLTVTCPSSNDGARAISTDNLFSMSGGTVTLSVAGNGSTYTNASNVVDTYSATCIKSDLSVDIYGGTLDLTCSGTDSKGISCDGIVNLNEGTYTLRATGTDSKAVKADQTLNINGGTYTVTCSGQESKGFSCDDVIHVTGGDVNLTISGKAGKGFKSDVTFAMYDGSITANISGETLVSGTDASNCVAVKSSGELIVEGGTINATCTSASGGAKGLSSVGNMTISGGNITITTEGAGATLSGSGTSCTDGYAPCCIKSEGNLTILAGVINCSSTGKGGKGIACDGILTIGTANADNNLIDIDVMTSGAPVNASSGGGGFGGGGSSSSDYWKGLPKGIKSVGNIVINSGHVSSYCAQTTGDSTGEGIESKDGIYINGGFIEANAYDDAINCANHIEVNGGYVWAYSRGNDAIDCNGAYSNYNGGIVIAAGKEEAIDANCDGMGGTQGHLVINGATIIAYRASSGGMGGGGGMALLDSPTYQNGQKYLAPTFSAGSKYCIKNSSGTTVLIYQHPSSITGSGFMTNSGIRPPGGGGSSSSYVFTSPNITSGTYTMYTNPTITGSANWHGVYVGATATTSGSGTSLTAQ